MPAAQADAGQTSDAVRRGRKAKDPLKPKAALSAFMLFSKAHRDKLKSANPALSFKEMGNTLGQMWRDAGDKEKSKYQKLADDDKERFKREMAGYTPPPEDGDGPKVKRSGKPRSALHIFAADLELEVRASLPDPEDLKAVGDALFARYSMLSAEEKLSYDVRAKAEESLVYKPKPKKVTPAKRERALKKQQELLQKQQKLVEKLEHINEELVEQMEVVDLSGDNPVSTMHLKPPPVVAVLPVAPVRSGSRLAAALWAPS